MDPMITTASGDPGQDNLRRAVRVGELTATDFMPGARAHARQGQRGVIQDYSNSHGLCYHVQHDDGTYAWYAPDELTDLLAS